MKGKFKKQISIFLTVLMLLFNVAFPSLSYAQEVTPTDSPAPEVNSVDVTPAPAETQIDNSGTIDNTSVTDSNTGNDTIGATPTPEPSPTDATPAPSDTPIQAEPQVTPEITVLTDAILDNALLATESAIPTSETVYTPDGSQSPVSTEQGSSGNNNTNSITTGDAISTTNIENAINTTSINSETLYQTINIYVTQAGDIDLSDPITIAVQALSERTDDPVINVALTGIHNFAYLSNDVVSNANTGNNLINTLDANGNIITGNAYSTVSVINKVNFVVINSRVHVVTINIYGDLNGNIVLPNLQSSQSCQSCGVSLAVDSTAYVQNNVYSNANTGLNSITASGAASIATGDAQSAVNVVNLVNSNYIGVTTQALYITLFGSWNGNFIGWDGFDPQTGGASLNFYNTAPNADFGSGCTSCTGDININNLAYISNNILSFANTGNNSINGANGSISTGNAFSAVSLINFINSNFIGSIGFFGFVNIFGNWTGDIGGKSQFDALNVQDDGSDGPPVQTSSVADNNNVQEQGGQLSVTNKNNVGAFVYPGDTVTFFVSAKNTGTGKVYGVKAYLYLIRNGQNVGGTVFNLEDIDAGKGKKLTTGFVLSKTAPGGEYIARTEIIGNVGPDNSEVSATADSLFTVFRNTMANAAFTANTPNNPQEILGAHYPLAVKNDSRNDYGPLYALITVIMTYLILRGIREKDKVMVIFGKRITLDERMKAFKMFLM